MDSCEQGGEKLFPKLINASAAADSTWKSSGMAAHMNYCY